MLTSLAKLAVLATCVFTAQSYNNQEPTNFLQKFSQKTSAEAQHIFQSSVNHVLHSEPFKIFNHPGFSDYAIRYKHPTLCDPNVKQISGYLDVGADKHFFFWFFESRDTPESDPVVLWLNGGPGGSSLPGLFAELGPCKVTDDGHNTYLHEHSWTDKANVIFLDQPLNVGYSYGKGDPWTTKGAAKDVYAFLQLFFSNFPQYADLDFHIAGESYGGHYVPAFSSLIIENNKDLPESSTFINLKSIMVGNGLTDPLVQYKYYAEMACNNSYAPALSQEACDKMTRQIPICEKLIQNCYNHQNPFACVPPSIKCDRDQIEPYMHTGLSPYDVRRECDGNVLCYEFYNSITTYLNIPEVMEELGAEVDKYETYNPQTGNKFQLTGDYMLPFVDLVPGLLEDGIRVLIYAGDADFVCNWMGNKAWTIELLWSGHEEFAQTNDTEWYSERLGKQAGELRRTEDGRFAFLRLFEAGHMAPYDQPESTLDMLQQWLNGELY